MEILNAHAETIETQLEKSFEMCAGIYARVNLDTISCWGRNGNALFVKYD